MSNTSLYFFEQTDFSLRFARCTISETSLRVEEISEVLASETGKLEGLAPAGSAVVCALRPKTRHLHRATASEAGRYPGLAGIQLFSQLQPFGKMQQAWFAGVQARDGAPATGKPWLVSLCSEAAHYQACAVFEAVGLKPERRLDAMLATAGAITSSATNPILLLEIGAQCSHALLIGPDGVLSVRTLPLNLDQIAAAVQAELSLDSRDSAVRIFLDPSHDFTKSGPAIAARLAGVMAEDLARLLAGQPAPRTLYCAGLPASQHWLGGAFAGQYGLALHAPNVKAWSIAAGMAFANPALEATIRSDWFGFLHFINSQTLESATAIPWQAELLSLTTPLPRRQPTLVGEAPRTEQDRPPRGHTAPPMAAAPGTAAVLTGKPATPPGATRVSFPAPTAIAAMAAARAAETSAPPAPPAPPKRQEERKGSPRLPWIAVSVVFLLVFLGIAYFYNESQKEEAARLYRERQLAGERLRQEQDKVRLAEQKAQDEAQARKQSELESARKLAEAETARAQAEAARRQAETEATNQAEAARRANARGNLVVTTIPAGANVTVGNLPARTSPATFSDLRIGKYPVTITLSRHEDVKLELEVTENGTTESGTVNLISFMGSLELVTNPAGADFEVYPVNTAIVSMDAQRTGKTPAKIEDLSPGDYSVTFSRPGWTTHTETIVVTRNNAAHLAWAFPAGTVMINTTPAGATVTSDGVKLGLTPVKLIQPAGTARYELSLLGYDAVSLIGTVENGKTAEFTMPLHESDRLFGVEELEQPPVAVSQKAPKLPSYLTLVDGRIVMQMTINRDGRPADIKIVRTSNPELGQIYAAAAAKWKFKPGLAGGKAVRSSVLVPILVSAEKY